jgi:hypothetical protein
VRWKKEKKVRKYPTTKKNKKIKKERDCIIACFLYTKVTKYQAIEALIILATWACKALKNKQRPKENTHKIPAKTKRKSKHFFLSLSSLPLAQTSGNGAHRGELWEFRNKSQRTPFESCTLITLRT